MKNLLLFVVLFVSLASCHKQENQKVCDDLNDVKKNFLEHLFNDSFFDEGPFQFCYEFRTVFYSRDLISLFGEFSVYTHLPHGWNRYEGKTFCRIDDQMKLITLDDLFSTPEQKEFLRMYCEDILKTDGCTYFGGNDPFYNELDEEFLEDFVVDDRFLIVFFQNYSVGGIGDGPFHVKIPYTDLEGHWNDSNPILALIENAKISEEYTLSWDEDEFYYRPLR